MRAMAQERGGECLSEKYADTRSKLRWRCGRCGHEWEATPSNIRRGNWCPGECLRARREISLARGRTKPRAPRYSIADMKRLAADRGGRCLSPAYVDAHTPLKWRCGECGREWMAAPSDVKKGTWCAVCSRRRRWARHHATRTRSTRRR
jgi:hypothetical protein